MSDSQDGEPEIRPGMEPLSPEEMERFLSRVRAQGRSLTSEEQYALFGPAKVEDPVVTAAETVEEMEIPEFSPENLAQLTHNFFFDLEDSVPELSIPLIRGVIFAFRDTLAYLTRPLADLMEEGARNAEAYMRSTGMDLPAEFWQKIIDARLFSDEKSAEEKEEHIADDAMSFLLQFFGYPASKMDPEVLRRTVDIFYAPEMMAWEVDAEAIATLNQLHSLGYHLAVIENYSCDRVFQRTIDYCGLRPCLDIALSSASVEYRKPDKRIFTFVLEQWDALAHEVVIVGSSLIQDVQGAIDLGAFSVQSLRVTSSQVSFDNEQVADQLTADQTITNLSQLTNIIQNWSC